MTEFDDKELLNKLKRIARISPDKEAAQRMNQNVRRALLAEQQSSRWSTILQSRFLKLAVAAVIIIGILWAGKFLLAPSEKVEIAGTSQNDTKQVVQQDIDPTLVDEAQLQEARLEMELERVEELFAKGDIEGLTAMLKSGRLEAKIAAAKYLAEIGDENAIDALEQLNRQYEGKEAAALFAEAIEQIKENTLAQQAAVSPDENVSGADPNVEEGLGMEIFVVEAGTSKPITDAVVKVYAGQRKEFATDKDGLCWVDFGEAMPDYLSMRIIKDGYVPMMFAWRDEMAKNLPVQFTMTLAKGSIIGGKVVDENDEPVENVEVKITVPEEESRQQPWISMRDHSVTTDKEGKWQTDIIPEDADIIRINLVHADYVQDKVFGRRKDYTVEELRDQRAVMVLLKGFALYGYVYNKDGQPVADAKVQQE